MNYEDQLARFVNSAKQSREQERAAREQAEAMECAAEGIRELIKQKMVAEAANGFPASTPEPISEPAEDLEGVR